VVLPAEAWFIDVSWVALSTGGSIVIARP